MSTSRPQKRDADGNAKVSGQPIVFQRPGCPAFEVDVRINVFGKEYHVHSIILRLNSAYFRKFLDSGDKVPAEKTSLFRYDYISVVDEDGEWGLEAVQRVIPNPDKTCTNKLKALRTEASETSAFERLLHALYSQPYIFYSYTDFLNIYRLADFYCALPALSSSLDSAMHNSPEFTKQIKYQSEELIRIAKKLHHPVLFRECLVYEVADTGFEPDLKLDHPPWTEKFDDDKELKLAFMMGIGRVDWLKTIADNQILRLMGSLGSLRHLVMGSGEENPMHSAYFYRTVRDFILAEGDFDENCECLEDLLENKLVFDRTGGRVGDSYLYFDYGGFQSNDERLFLCAEIRDEDLPWDRSSIEW
ncbi:hypothetical protein NHQ30_002829 [Ciborinia camelliae]|nr:hypothetical protein NHQ30_002829 [Ciborinia camelliae]